VDEFLVERWMNLYENHVEVNLAETCVEPFTLGEFLKIAEKEDFFEGIMDERLNYGHIQGSPELREGIAGLYDEVDPANIILTGGAIEANFIVFYSLIKPGDTVISVFPVYQQLYSVPESFGAEVKRLCLRPERRWLPEIEKLKEHIDHKTKMVVINNPHNPTGSLMDERLLRSICEIADDVGANILCDEAYRGLYIKTDDYVPSIMDVSDNAIVTGSFSKSISLTGLRLGWITANSEIIRECMIHRDYTTISKSIIDDALATVALQKIDKIMDRNLKIVRKNHRYLSEWIKNEPLIDWVPPMAGSVAFMRHHLAMSSEELCLRLIKEKSTFMVPGDCFEHKDYIRIGYGNRFEAFEEGLRRFNEFLDFHRSQERNT